MLGHGLTERSDNVAAQDDVALDRRIAQVEITVLQTDGFVGITAAIDFKGQLILAAAAENFNLRRHDLNLAGRLLRVLARTFADDTGHTDGRFLVDAAHGLE